MRQLVLTILLALTSVVAQAQGFRVKSFKQSETDLLATVVPHVDGQGRPCAMLKVVTKVPGVKFTGGVVGKVEYRNGEYWAYMPQGTSEIVITRPDYLPLVVRFADYGINELEQRVTYSLVLKDESLQPDKYGVMLVVTPKDANIRVDGFDLKPDAFGRLKLNLAKGDHTCTVSAVGFASQSRRVTTGRESVSLNVDLESILAELTVVAPAEATITINGEKKGKGQWKGEVMPGQYVVMAEAEGFLPKRETLTLEEKEVQTFEVTDMERIKSNITVSTEPEGCEVSIDGHPYGHTPVTIPAVDYGKHTLTLEVDSNGVRREQEQEVEVTSTDDMQVSVSLITDDELALHKRCLDWFRQGVLYDLKGETTSGYFPPRDPQVFYDSIVALVDTLDPAFFAHQYYVPEYEGHSDISPYQQIGDRLFRYYTYISLESDEPIRLKNGTRYTYLHQPYKALKVARRAGKELTEQEMAYVAMSYNAMKQDENSVEWFRKWWEKAAAKEEPSSYAAGRMCFFCAEALKRLGVTDEARQWYERALPILTKTEKNAAKLKQYRQAAK